MKIFTNHRFALITGIVLAFVLAFLLHKSLTPEAGFNHLALARWVHIVSGVFWIGLLYYLNAVQVPAQAAATEDKGGPGPAAIGRRLPAISDASSSSGTFSGRGATAASISAGGPPRNTVTGSGASPASATA